MNAKHFTWDRALLAWAVGAGRRKPARAALIVVLAVGLGVGLLPGVAQAHEWGPPGLNGAQLHVSPDGYEPDSYTFFGVEQGVQVSGKGFKGPDVAQVFQCEEGAVDLHAECQLLTTTPTNLSGEFTVPNDLTLLTNFVRPGAGGTQGCKNGQFAMGEKVQCSLVAATFGPDLQPTSKAEHLICFDRFGPCNDKPTGSWSTTTTIPPKAANVSMGQDGYEGYYPDESGERLTRAGGDASRVIFGNVDVWTVNYTPPINVAGQDFLPNDVVELFQCNAGETGDLRVKCNALGTAPTSTEGEFTATVSLGVSSRPFPQLGGTFPQYGANFLCRGEGEQQCSVIAATFDRTNPGVDAGAVQGGDIRPTSRGENYVCFEGPETCANKPGAPVPTTTTTSTTVVPPPITHNVADFDANGSTDVSVFRPSSSTWFVKDGLTTTWGTEGDIAVPADYDGNGSADVAVFRPSSGVWFVQGGASAAYGTEGDIPVPGDYDGDGSAEFAVFRPSSGTWFVNGGITASWGTSGDIPVPGDYTGDGATDIAVFRPSNSTWFVKDGITATFGTSGDIPVPADYDADATETTELAVFRPSTGTWFVYGQGAFHYGTSGDVPVAGHYDVDPYIDIAVFRPSSGTWFIDGGPTSNWGASSDIALPLPHAVHRYFF